MDDEGREFYTVVGGLLKALAGLIVAFFVIALFVYTLPVILRSAGEPEIRSWAESIREFARGFGAVVGGLLWAIFALVIIILIIGAVASFLPLIFKTKPWKYIKIRDDALESLRLRYAKGEITKEQYVEMKKVLEEEP
jgi:uncharacterized membrane protein